MVIVIAIAEPRLTIINDDILWKGRYSSPANNHNGCYLDALFVAEISQAFEMV
jgi:hypothetical protein